MSIFAKIAQSMRTELAQRYTKSAIVCVGRVVTIYDELDIIFMRDCIVIDYGDKTELLIDYGDPEMFDKINRRVAQFINGKESAR